MKIFLGNSPWRKQGFYGVRAGSRWPHFEREGACYMPFPFFLAYAAALLEKHGHDVLLVDGIAEGLTVEDMYGRIAAFQPDIVVYEVSTPSIELDLSIARETRVRISRKSKMVFCGPHHSMYASDFLNKHHEVDFVIRGEYEFTLLDLVQTLQDGRSLNNVTGLIHRSLSGDVTVNPQRVLETDLEKFPWPARHHLPMDKYIDLPGGIPPPSLQIWASRGCPFQCIFCSWPQIMYGSSQYRVRDPKDVVAEIDWCIKKYNFQSVYFDDDTFNIGKPRMLQLCDAMKQAGIRVPWAIMARADCMDREILTAMKDAGLVALKYGVESGNPEILAQTGKSLDLEKVRETVKITKELGIKYHLTFTFGLPGETWKTIARTINTAIELDPDSLQFSIVTPFPGSKYYDQLDKKGFILSKNWEEYDGYNRAVIRTDNLTPRDLERALRTANRRWKRHRLIKMLKLNPIQTFKDVFMHPLNAFRSYRG